MSASTLPTELGIGGDRTFPCVRLRGLPFDVTDDNIRVFLGCDPLDIMLVKRDGRFSGEAYIVLSSHRQLESVIKKDKSYIGRRYIEVFLAKKTDYYKAILTAMTEGMVTRPGIASPQLGTATAAREPADDSTVLRLRGLPFNATAEEVVAFFEDVADISTENVHLVTEGGKPMGIAYVEFTSASDAAHAAGKDRQMMGSRYVEIFPSSPHEMIRSMKACGINPMRSARAVVQHTQSGAKVLLVQRAAGRVDVAGPRRRWYESSTAPTLSTKRTL